MKNFKSQICTTKEQSQKLLALGLKKETADMMYITSVVDGLGKWLPEEYRYYSLEIGEYHKPIGKGMLHIPAWSLHRLMEILSYTPELSDFAIELQYDAMIIHIANAIETNNINKDYLEEKK